jgi:hypothetical protein
MSEPIFVKKNYLNSLKVKINLNNINSVGNTRKLKYSYVKPDMIVDFYMGRTAKLGLKLWNRTTYNFDPRAFIGLEGTNTPMWQLGIKGWVILGFTNGFNLTATSSIQIFETGGKGEWVDVWVAKDLPQWNHHYGVQRNFTQEVRARTNVRITPYIPTKTPVINNKLYGSLRIDDLSYYKRPIRPGESPYFRRALYSKPDNQLALAKTPDWIPMQETTIPTSVKNSVINSGNGKIYSGNIITVNSDSQASEMLGQEDTMIGVDNGWYFVGSIQGTGKKGVRSEQIGDFPFPGKYKYMLIQDNGKYSVEGGADMQGVAVFDTSFEVPDNYFFLLLIDDSASVDKDTYRKKYIEYIKIQLKEWGNLNGDNMNKYIGLRFIRWKDSSGSDRAKNEGYSKYPAYYVNNMISKENTDSIYSWISFNNDEDIKTVLSKIDDNNSGLKLDKNYTPLIEALDDVINFDLTKNTESYTGSKKFDIFIITDGIPDPGNFGFKPNGEKYSKDYIKGKTWPGLTNENSYSVISRLEKIMELTGKPIPIKIKGRFPDNVSEAKWVYKEYSSNPRLKNILEVQDLNENNNPKPIFEPIKHEEVFHTDSTKHSITEHRRIGKGAAKNMGFDFQGNVMQLPETWVGIRNEDSSEYAKILDKRTNTIITNE